LLLSAVLRRRCRLALGPALLLSIDNSRPHGAQQQTAARRGSGRMMGQTDGRTDGRTHGRFISRPLATDAQLCRAWSTSSVDKAAEAETSGT